MQTYQHAVVVEGIDYRLRHWVLNRLFSENVFTLKFSNTFSLIRRCYSKWPTGSRDTHVNIYRIDVFNSSWEQHRAEGIGWKVYDIWSNSRKIRWKARVVLTTALSYLMTPYRLWRWHQIRQSHICEYKNIKKTRQQKRTYDQEKAARWSVEQKNLRMYIQKSNDE